MKNWLICVLACAWATDLTAQITLSGSVRDVETGEPIAGATLSPQHTFLNTYTNKNGFFLIKNLPPGMTFLRVSSLGYQDTTLTLELTETRNEDINLRKEVFVNEEVIISSVRASEKSGVAYATLSSEDLRRQNLGQDIPFLLNTTPSVVVTSDAGTGVGYTNFRIRGSDITQVNVTVNGIPINDAESHGVWWVNMPDMASSTESLQIQRGVGTSSNGAAAFGATMNLQTIKLNSEPYGEIANAFGSFNTRKHTLSLGSGLIKDKFTFDGRLSQIASDGYIDRASSDLRSFFVSGAYYGHKNLIRVNVFSGKEKTYQAWNGVPEALLATNRTYNAYTYENQTDNYKQDHYQLIYNQQLGSRWNLNTALHFTRGRGYYEQYKEDQKFKDYGLEDVVINNQVVSTTDLVRQLWLDNDFYGGVWSLNYRDNGIFSTTLGGGANRYDGDHFGEVIWAKYASTAGTKHRYYFNNAVKTDFNIYSKTVIDLTERFSIAPDLQYRRIQYSFLGYDANLNNTEQAVTLNFFNPKIGFTYDDHQGNTAYVFLGIGHKEPNRDDYTQSSPTERPRPEKLKDLEFGYKRKAKNYSAGVNFFYMNYKDQLVLTGEINQVGAYNRTNIAKSFRAGVETEFSLQFDERFYFNANLTYSINRIKEFHEFVDDYDNNTQVVNEYRYVDIAFSPALVGSANLRYRFFRNMETELIQKYVSRQFLDNTSHAERSLQPFWTTDVRIIYSPGIKFLKKLDFTLQVNNIFNRLYEPNGYTFSYITGGELVTENYYFPQAGVNFAAGLTIRF